MLFRSTYLVDLANSLILYAKKNFYIQRFKGLGEMNPSQLWETTLNPKNRSLINITIDNFRKADTIFSTLMGDFPASRKDFIKDNALNINDIDC